ncbi:MAG: hypothetical protein Q9217_005716 [Psora testacea]
MTLCPQDWDLKRLTDEINFIAFGTSVLTSSFAIQDLVLHPEYIAPLRQEIESMGDINSMKIDDLPLLDSFIKESMRTNCFEACQFPVEFPVYWTSEKALIADLSNGKVGYRRLALDDFQFLDGYKVAKGDWVGIPLLEMLREETQYPNAHHFDGFRFSRVPRTDAWKTTHFHQNWPFWGTQKQLW